MEEEMTEPVEGRAVCDQRAGQCRCFRDAGHPGREHHCDPRRCTGAWKGTWGEDDFEVVDFPYPVGPLAREPWPE